MSKEIIIQVADEIENDPNYSGKYYWNYETNSGCAMIRLFQKFGGEVITDPDKDSVHFKLDNFRDNENFNGCFINDAIEYLTKIPESFWDTFLDFSIHAERLPMANALRYITSENFNPDINQYELKNLAEKVD